MGIQLAKVLMEPINVLNIGLVAHSYIGHMTAVRITRLAARIKQYAPCPIVGTAADDMVTAAMMFS